jgi:hypothetical protein
MPEGVSGNPALIRLSSSLLDRGGGNCVEFTALKARPKVVPNAWERRYAPWEAFPLGIVSHIVYMVEFDGVSAENAIGQVIRSSRTSIHPGVVSWVQHATLTYLAVDAQLAAALSAEGIELRPQSRPRVIQHAVGGSVRMLTAWGLRNRAQSR